MGDLPRTGSARQPRWALTRVCGTVIGVRMSTSAGAQSATTDVIFGRCLQIGDCDVGTLWLGTPSLVTHEWLPCSWSVPCATFLRWSAIETGSTTWCALRGFLPRRAGLCSWTWCLRACARARCQPCLPYVERDCVSAVAIALTAHFGCAVALTRAVQRGSRGSQYFQDCCVGSVVGTGDSPASVGVWRRGLMSVGCRRRRICTCCRCGSWWWCNETR